MQQFKNSGLLFVCLLVYLFICLLVLPIVAIVVALIVAFVIVLHSMAFLCM